MKRPENLTEEQTVKFKELLRYNLRSVRAYLLSEEFQRFWTYHSPDWAARFLDEWCAKGVAFADRADEERIASYGGTGTCC